MKLGIIGLGHAYSKQIEAIKKFNEIEITAVCDTNPKMLDKVILNVFKTTNYKKLIKVCDYVLISSPPDSHLKIAEFFIKNNIKVILEKPIVNSTKELNKLKTILEKYNQDFYNTLHFSFGDEIIWAKNNLSHKKPLKINSFISDKYVENNRIKEENVSLCGAYLDETINPLSAIAVIFGKNVKFCNLERKKFKKDKYDYFSRAIFKVENVESIITVDWANGTNDKYIDLIYDDGVIRLDSMNQCVKNLSTGKILFKSDGDRMTNHYVNSFNSMLKIKENSSFSLKLHEELLKDYD